MLLRPISLDDAAGKATEAIDFANETIETENYTMADFDRQAEVDQALNKAKSIRLVALMQLRLTMLSRT